MWPFKKKVPPPIKEKKPVKVKVSMSVTLVNNRTDKEYIIKSSNEFGLLFKMAAKEAIRIRQRTGPRTDEEDDDGENDSWILIGSFTDFSVAAVEWVDVTIYV